MSAEKKEGEQENSPPDLESIIMEIDHASPDLADFLRWCANTDDGDLEDNEFNLVASAAYSYARAKNDQSAVGTLPKGE